MTVIKPNPYIPSFLESAIIGNRPVQLSWSDVADTNIRSTSSFSYDATSLPLKSTQQLNVDWSQFQNHTFFMSAEAKVNLAFDQIINGYPFDGTRKENEVFFEKLTGFERWVFDQFPKNKGALLFSGTQIGENGSNGTYIVVQDKVGSLFPELSKANTGSPVINPKGSTSLTIEMQLFIPATQNGTQVVCQKMSGSTQGFSFYLMPTSSTSSVEARFSVVSNLSHMTVPVTLNKGTFNHVAVVLNKNLGTPMLQSFFAEELFATAQKSVSIGDLDIDAAAFIIGSGSTLQLGASAVVPQQTLSGTIDEFRVFHSVRSAQQQASYAQKALYATDDLVLYYRFNEPAPPIALSLGDPINSIVLDYSGNSLHSMISNFTGSLRVDASADPLSPMVYEKPETFPVLFPAHPGVVFLNQQLLASASAYDAENPNLITRLVPQHYLLEGAQQDGFQELEGTVNQAYTGDGIPGQGQMGSVQILVSLLYIWAKFFDELKLFVESFSTLKTVRYDVTNTVPDSFLLDVVKHYGFHLPPLFNDSTLEQYVRAENVQVDSISTNEHSLRYVQNQLLRRVLVNMPDVLRSKGTQHSIKSFLRAVGIDPDTTVRIREFGGPTTQQLAFVRENKFETNAMVQFVTSSLVVSPYLSASRSEPGFPQIAGSLTKLKNSSVYVSNNKNDGLLTSGSWTCEGIIKYTPIAFNSLQSFTQSLMRLCVTGSSLASAGVVANLVATTDENSSQLLLFLRSGDSSSSPLLQLTYSFPSLSIFDADKWNVSFGCQRNDSINSPVSSSYFLRLAHQNAGNIDVFESSSSFFFEAPRNEHNVFRALSATTNASGAYIAIGSNQHIAGGTGASYCFLNDSSAAPGEARATCFDGRMSNVRFWSKALTLDEWREHVLNYASTGVVDPLVNWNYVSTRSGSFEHLRLDTMTKQDTRNADSSGHITLIDYSENNMHLTGSGFTPSGEAVVGEVFDTSYISPYYDEASTNEKVRVRSFNDYDTVQHTPWASLTPVYEILPSEAPTDDVRFAVEFSLVDALNRDIIKLFATLDSLDNALGAPELVFCSDYPDIEQLRNVYFNRIKDKLNFQAFFELFRWFDMSIGTFIQQLIPRKTDFMGVNYTIESHMLERHKLEYLSSDIYLGDSNRARLNSTILLQQIVGTLRKF